MLRLRGRLRLRRLGAIDARLRYLLLLGASLRFLLLASFRLLSCLHRGPSVHLLTHRSLLLLGASLRFELFSL